MADPVDRTIAEDLACPVEIQPGKDEATPPDWTWRRTSSSLPNAAIFHLSHSFSVQRPQTLQLSQYFQAPRSAKKS